MKRSSTVAVCLLGVVGIFWLAWAGNLEPPGAPASTMVTLQQIYEKLDECTENGLCGVSKTGQTGCWDESGVSIECSGTGQDGELRRGTSVTPRFTDNADGTVTDNLTGLIWLKYANCFNLQNWTNGLSLANSLSSGSCELTDGSVAGDWRLPNVKELGSLIDYGRYNPAVPSNHGFVGVQSDIYWSSTSYENSTDHAWFVTMNAGRVYRNPKTNTHYIWPVRGGM